jgi:EAL and modified HD-GYP domain-containing signal transduction protein
VKLIGERIESYEQFDRCKTAGIGYFQGYVFCQPKTVAGKVIPSNRLSQVQLIAALQNPEVTLEELDAVIIRDLGVSYRLLRWINSAYFSLPRKVNSVHEALVLLGARNVRS